MLVRLVTPTLLLAALLAPSQAMAFRARPVPFQKGITLASWGSGGYQPQAVDQSLESFKRRGIQWVTLLEVWNQTSLQSIDVQPGKQTVKDENLIHAIRKTHQLGMHVLLRPYVDVLNGKWRGLIVPSNVDAWFASYTRFTVKYAQLAKREGIGAFVFASEMDSMSQKYPKQWSKMAERVRANYPGPVGYETNWNEIDKVGWLRSLDFIGVSAYNILCSSPTNSVTKLTQGWQHWVPRMARVAKDNNRPIVFTEIGYRPLADTCMHPWNSRLQDGATDFVAQTNAYRASYLTWWKVSWFRGMHWWTEVPVGSKQTPRGHTPLVGPWDQTSAFYKTTALGEKYDGPAMPIPNMIGITSQNDLMDIAIYAIFVLLIFMAYARYRKEDRERKIH